MQTARAWRKRFHVSSLVGSGIFPLQIMCQTIYLRPSRIGGLDVIGNAYEFLIGNFASDAGKKAGEFYTSPEVSLLLTQLLRPSPGNRVGDPACGSGSLLIKMGQTVPANAKGERDVSLYGMEANGATWALCKMNMFLHEFDQGGRVLEPDDGQTRRRRGISAESDQCLQPQ